MRVIKLTFQSSVVTSLLFSFVLPLTCFNTNTFKGALGEPDLLPPSAIVQIRAVESPDLKFEMTIVKCKNGFCFCNSFLFAKSENCKRRKRKYSLNTDRGIRKRNRKAEENLCKKLSCTKFLKKLEINKRDKQN